MQTGVIGSHNVSNVLRGIAQKRQQGVLHIEYQERSVSLYFVQGKIVEVREEGLIPAQEIVQALKSAGLINVNTVIEANTYTELVETIKKITRTREELDEAVVRRAIRHRVLDKLYSLDFSREVPYTFDLTLIDVEREYAQSISVGQVLLDMDALLSQSVEFQAHFPAEMFVVRLDRTKPALETAEEDVIWDAIGKGSSTEELKSHALLNRLLFQTTLLEMLGRELIAVQSTPEIAPVPAAEESAPVREISPSLVGAVGGTEPLTTPKSLASLFVFDQEVMTRVLVAVALGAMLLVPPLLWNDDLSALLDITPSHLSSNQ